jgi:predicted metal-dependent HD superfamily phosphohydrolase
MGLWQRCTAADTTSDPNPAWDTLHSLYTEAHRHYHGLDHLAHCLTELDAVRAQLHRVDEVEMAVWFHDAIHQPGRTDNEARSAALFATTTNGAMRPEFIETTVNLILATTHSGEPALADEQYICDIDMSSFGMCWEQFLSDSVNLRREFQGTDEDYFPAKVRFLEALLQKPRIYYTSSFFERYEQKARDNIRRVLELIAKGNVQP